MDEYSPEQREIHERVVTSYLPAWCAAQEIPPDASTFNPDWSFLTLGMAYWLRRAIDERVVEVRDGWPTLQDSRHTYFFEKGGGRVRAYREGFVEVAAAGMLALKFGWPPQRLTFQSPRRGRARVWAFDLLAYADDEHTEVSVAGEAKWRQRDAVDLVRALGVCGERGDHLEDECREKKSDHRKFEGLVAFRPELLWIIGPDAFLDEPDLVFAVEIEDEFFVRLTPTRPDVLAA